MKHDYIFNFSRYKKNHVLQIASWMTYLSQEFMNFEFDLPSICHFNFAAHRQGDGKLGGGLKYVYFYFHPYLGKMNPF